MLSKLQTFADYPRFVQGWLLPVVMALMIAKVLIHLVSFKRLSHILGTRTGTEPWTPVICPRKTRRARQVSNLINVASRYTLTEVNCFPKTLVARVLLTLYHVPHCCFFGLRRKNKGGDLDAHAWVVAGDCGLGDRRSFRCYTIVGVFSSNRHWASMQDESRTTSKNVSSNEGGRTFAPIINEN
mgnify:CR=1 FL=1